MGSATRQEIFVAADVVDEGKIKVMTHSPNGISVIKTGQRLAQLILVKKCAN